MLDISCPNERDPGFSLVELVVVISILGLLAAVAIPRFVASDTFASRGFFDQATETVRYAQKTSIAWRQQIFVCVTGTAITASAAAGCATPLTHPTTGAPLTATAPGSVTLAGANFSFTAPTPTTAGGRPSPDAQVTITITNASGADPVRRIIVERETGYVHNN